MGNKNNKPIVPKGWVAVWDDTYNEWFYVDESTGKSQWEAPKGTSFGEPKEDAPPPYSEVVDNPAPESAGKGPRINMPSTAKPQSANFGASQPYPPYPQQYPQYPPQPYPQPYGQPPYGQPPYAQPAPYPQQYPANYNQPSRSRFGGMGGMGMLGGLGAGALGGLLLGEMMTPDTVIYENNDYGGGDYGGGDFGGDF